MVGMPKVAKKKFPQGDVHKKVSVPKVGPDEINSTQTLNQSTTPNLPNRDGPARMAPKGAPTKRPPTAKKPNIAAMRASLAKVM